MAITAAEITALQRYLGNAVELAHLARSDWRRQTDIVQEAFIVARLFLDTAGAAVFVDGHIDNHLKREAIESGDVKGFFNRRFHDLGFKSRRIILYDTVTTRKMGARKSGQFHLHFHAVFELPRGWSRARLDRLLSRVFGTALPMGRRQFHMTSPRWDQPHTHNGVTVVGPLGKLLYVASHGGATYAGLKLNDGKRSRKAPASRGAYNRRAAGLARGIPSNFNGKTVFCDHASKEAGREAFDAWVKTQKAAAALVLGPKARAISDVAPTVLPEDDRKGGEQPA